MAKWIKDTTQRWITPGGDPVWCCSDCLGGRHVFGIENCDDQPNICPDCGAKMENAQKVVRYFIDLG